MSNSPPIRTRANKAEGERQKVQIAEGVREGLTNVQIAARYHIPINTVSHHTGRLRGNVLVDRRGELRTDGPSPQALPPRQSWGVLPAVQAIPDVDDAGDRLIAGWSVTRHTLYSVNMKQGGKVEPRPTYHVCTPARRNQLADAAQAAAGLQAASYALSGLLDVLSKRAEATVDEAAGDDLEQHLDAAWLQLQTLSRELEPWLSYRIPVQLPCPEEAAL